jgi:hypothetical protein
MLVENNHALIHGVRLLYTECGENEPAKTLLNESHLKDFALFLRYQIANEEKLESWMKANVALHRMFEKEKSPAKFNKNNPSYPSRRNWNAMYEITTPTDEEKRYIDLRDCLTEMCKEYYPSCSLSLASRYSRNRQSRAYRSEFSEQYFFIVHPSNLNNVTPEAAKDLNEIIGKLDSVKEGSLNKHGYHINDGYICIKLENNHAQLDKLLSNYVHEINKNNYIPPKMEPVYLYIKDADINQNKYNTMCLVRNLLMYRHRLITWLEKDFDNDTMASIAWYRRSAKLLTAQKTDSHMDNDDLRAVQCVLHKESLSDELYLLLLHQYTNIKIALMFRRMLECEALQKPHPFWELYPDSRIEEHGNRCLTSLYDVFSTIKDEGVHSCVLWLKVMLDAVDIYIDGTHITQENFQAYVSKYEFLEFSIAGKSRWYCLERFASIVLDFLFSAMKHGADWNLDSHENVESRNYIDGHLERYKYYIER